jgi:DedD protein
MGDASADTKRVDPSGADPKAAAAGVATVKAVADTAKPRPDAKPETRADAKTEAPSDPKSAPKSDATRPAKSATKADAKFAVQAAAPRSEQAARELMAKLKSAGLPAFVERTEAADGPRWRVRVGPYPNRADAERARTRLRELGHGADLVAL